MGYFNTTRCKQKNLQLEGNRQIAIMFHWQAASGIASDVGFPSGGSQKGRLAGIFRSSLQSWSL